MMYRRVGDAQGSLSCLPEPHVLGTSREVGSTLDNRVPWLLVCNCAVEKRIVSGLRTGTKEVEAKKNEFQRIRYYALFLNA